jgi:hypothetical protein
VGIASIWSEDPAHEKTDLVDLFPTISGNKADYYYIYKKRYAKLGKITCLYEFLKEKIDIERQMQAIED